MGTQGLIYQFIILRALVGFLGEKLQFGWWDSNFLGETGLKFLSIVCPRSAFAAGINSVTESARRLHDERIGKGGVYHLFRLSPGMEQSIHEHLTFFDYSELLQLLQTKDTALEKLQTYTNGDVKASEGPIQIGTSKDISQDSAIKNLAIHYADALNKRIQTFPYFIVR